MISLLLWLGSSKTTGDVQQPFCTRLAKLRALRRSRRNCRGHGVFSRGSSGGSFSHDRKKGHKSWAEKFSCLTIAQLRAKENGNGDDQFTVTHWSFRDPRETLPDWEPEKPMVYHGLMISTLKPSGYVGYCHN